jgi:glutamyl-tRNA reductase
MITMAGISHHNATLEARERLSLPVEALEAAAQRVSGEIDAGATLLSTCNRLELYTSGQHEDQQIRSLLATVLDAEPVTIERSFELRHGAAAVRHLYRVASGIESMVVGESEILGQVRGAFSLAVSSSTDDPLLSHLFHTAIRTGRRARSETSIGHHALSTSSIAAQQVRERFTDISTVAVLILGTGEAGRLAAEALADAGVTDFRFVNRTLAHAEALAAEVGGRAASLDQLEAELATSAVAITASSAPEPLLTEAIASSALRRRDTAGLLIIDLGLPRDVEPGVRELPGVAYRDLEDLQLIAARHSELRLGEIPAVERIVDEAVERFEDWHERRRAVPTIRELTVRAEELRARQVERAFRGRALSPEERARVEEIVEPLSRALVRQLLHQPITRLRQGGDRDGHVDAVRELFALDELTSDALLTDDLSLADDGSEAARSDS